MSDCVFCKIVAHELPSAKVYEDELILAFNDLSPAAPVHFLLVPKVHISSAAELGEENSAVVAHIFTVISRLAKELELDGFRVITNAGQSAGQTVGHLHFHVLSGRELGILG
jgi:histidine triad (HIT) family protein